MFKIWEWLFLLIGKKNNSTIIENPVEIKLYGVSLYAVHTVRDKVFVVNYLLFMAICGTIHRYKKWERKPAENENKDKLKSALKECTRY